MDKEIALEFTLIKEQLKTFVTKDEFYEFKDLVSSRFDEQMVILKRLDQDRYSTFERIQRIEKKIL